MKHYNLFFLFIILSVFFSLTSCTNNNNDTATNNLALKEQNMYTVCINGKTVNDLYAFVSTENVKLPFLETIHALGMKVETESDNFARIICGNDIFMLHYSTDIVLVKQGDEEDNLMIPPPGNSSYYCMYEYNDVILDYETLSGTLYLMGVSAHISIDHTNNMVNINYAETNK